MFYMARKNPFINKLYNVIEGKNEDLFSHCIKRNKMSPEAYIDCCKEKN